MMSRILLVGFDKYGKNMYPHLRCFIDQLSLYCELDYFHFRERGNLFEHILRKPYHIKSYLIVIKLIINTIIDSIKLFIKGRNYNVIIAIDFFTYAIVGCMIDSFLGKLFYSKNSKVILWSHDIIAADHPFYNFYFVKLFTKLAAKNLEKHLQVIIQDRERLELLLQSFGLIADFKLDCYFMPVFLRKMLFETRDISSYKQPRLMQCGGIGLYRSSDKILQHYQENADCYRLYFHGYIFEEMQEMINNCVVKPMVSSITVDGDKLYQIVNHCDIGFVAYEQIDKNFFYLEKASGQMVEFIRMGIPVIVMGKTNLKEFVCLEGIGVAISETNDLNQAINRVKDDYRGYSERSIACFNKYFSHEKYIPKILEWIYH